MFDKPTFEIQIMFIGYPNMYFFLHGWDKVILIRTNNLEELGGVRAFVTRQVDLNK